MRVIIAGSRSITDGDEVEKAIAESGFPITRLITGGARGVDRVAIAIARSRGIPVSVFHANWDRYGKRAGFIRNAQMAKYADGLIAVWDGHSRGTRHMIETARRCGLQVYVHIVDGRDNVQDPCR